MVDERFDVVHGARLWWWRGKRMFPIAWSAGHIVDALLDNPQALAHLLDVYGRTIVTVARAANRYIEFELVVAGIGLFLAKSQSRPHARRFGPVIPHSIASSIV